MYHPRCKDVHSTYFEGISTPPEGSQYTADELDEMAQQYEAQQKQGYCERQEKRYERIGKYSLDEDNQRIYGARAKAYGEKAEQFGKVAKSFEKQPEYLRNNLPKGYKDTRNIGNPISEEDLSDIMNYAAENGVQIGTADNITGGFEHYCGDKNVLYSMIDELKRQQESSLFKNSKADKMILKYDNVLGFENDNSKIDIGAFAITKGRTITLNKFMFDDTQYLKKEYEEAVKEGFFVKDSTIDNIIAHEVGHVIDHKTKGLYQKVFKSLVNQSNLKGVSIDEYLVENISIYASDLAKDDKYHELLAEINSLLKTNPESGIIKIIKSEEVIL